MGHKVSCLSILMGIILLLSACGAKNELIYRVEGSALEAEISYTDTEGETFSETVSLPWQTSLKGNNDIDFQLSALRTSDSGSIGCAVIINEKSLAYVEAKVFAECKGSFSRNGGTTRSNASTRIDPPSLLMPVIADEIHAALEADALPSVEKDWTLELYEQALDCRAVDKNLTKAEFSLQIPTGFVIETCESENVTTGYATFKDEAEKPSFIIELPWFEHSKNKNTSLGDAWELLDEHAASIVTAGNGIRIDNRSEIEHNGEYMPFLDMVQIGDKVVLSRLVLLLGKNGEGMGFYVEQELEGSSSEAYARLDALTREMISSAIIDSFSPNIRITQLAAELNEDGSAKNVQTRYPEGTKELYAVFTVEEFLPESTISLKLSKEGELVSQEEIVWGERDSDGTFAFLLTQDIELLPGKYRFSYERSSTTANGSSFDTLATSVTIGKLETEYVDEIFALNEEGNTKAALELGEKAVIVYPNSADVLNNMAISFRMEGKTNEAIEVLQKAIVLAPEFINPYYQLGVIYQDDNDPENAFNYFTKGIDLGIEGNLTSAMHLRRGVIYYTQDDLIIAMSDFDKAYQLNPNNTQALFNHALTAKDLEDFDLAIEKLNLALESWVDDVWIYRHRADSYEALGEKDLATADFEKILSLTEDAELVDIANAGLERLNE